MTHSVNKIIGWIVAVIFCVALAGFAANLIAQESSGYVASIVFFSFLFIYGTPIYLLLLGCGIVYFLVEGKSKYWIGKIYITSAFLLPLSFVIIVKIMELIGYARYINDAMTPIP